MVFKKKARRSFRRSFTKRRASRSSSSSMTPMNLLMGAAIYGAARPYVANMMPTLFNVGPVDSDNAIIGVAGYYGMKKGKGIVKGIAMAALAGETAMVASKLASGVTTSTSTSSTY